MVKKSKKKIVSLSQLKFDKKNLPTPEEFAEMLINLDRKLKEIDEKRQITDYKRLHIPMTI